MSNSPLATYEQISPNKSTPRSHKIDTVSIHCTAGNKHSTAQQIVDLSHFITYDPVNGASCNYAIGGDGSIALGVDEADRSWCTSSNANDNRAITIEVASNSDGTEVTNEAYSSLINLLVDICQRNGIEKLRWQADKSLIGQVDKQNMSVHRWFVNKACPGEWLYSRHGQIAAEVNSRMEVGMEVGGEMTQQQFNMMMNTYLAQQGDIEPGEWSKTAREWAEENGLIQGDANDNKKYKQPCSREQMVIFLHRFFNLFCK